MSLFKDFSAAALASSFVTVLVGFISSAAIVFQAASALGIALTAEQDLPPSS
jgi:benzoate membrane transport protein